MTRLLVGLCCLQLALAEDGDDPGAAALQFLDRVAAGEPRAAAGVALRSPRTTRGTQA